MKSIDSFLKDITNKKMLVVYPHPDDESVMAGGLIQRAVSLGFQVTVLTLTEGERGKIHINGKGRSTPEIRRQELTKAMSVLGVTDWVMWKFPDGKLRQENNWQVRLEKFILDTQPGIMVSYDLSGVTAHPDHISLAREVLRIVRKIKGTKLIWTSFEGLMKQKMVDTRVEKYLQKPDYVLDLNRQEARRKWQAVFAHRSQALGGFLGSSWWLLMFAARQEWYAEANLKEKYGYKYVPFKI